MSKYRGKPGPSSRPEVLANLDGRTRAGKILRSVESDLIADLGGDENVTAAERLLVQSASVKACRLALLSDKLLEGAEPSGDEHHLLSWANSLRLDLVALGLKRRARDVGLPAPRTLRERALATVLEAAE